MIITTKAFGGGWGEGRDLVLAENLGGFGVRDCDRSEGTLHVFSLLHLPTNLIHC